MWFVGYILAHRWTDALPYPSLRQMSRRTGISTQMLHRYKQSLVEKGYLATIPRHRPSGGRTSNSYDFSGLFARLEQLLRRDRRDPAWQPTADESEEQEQEEQTRTRPRLCQRVNNWRPRRLCPCACPCTPGADNARCLPPRDPVAPGPVAGRCLPALHPRHPPRSSPRGHRNRDPFF